MSNVRYISQVALGVTTAVKLGNIFTGEMGGNSFALMCVSGSVTLGMDNTVVASSGWPMTAGQVISFDSQSFRQLWAIGGATDRLAVITEG